MEDPWDKHDASGLVLYTDAVYWEKQRGDFDERHVDDLGVDETRQFDVDMCAPRCALRRALRSVLTPAALQLRRGRCAQRAGGWRG